MYFLRGILICTILLAPSAAMAGGYCGSCQAYYPPTIYRKQADVYIEKSYEVTPLFVSFIPAQVAVGATVVNYQPPQSQSALGYSYIPTGPQPQQVQPQAQVVQQPQATVQAAPEASGGDLECLKRIEARLLAMEKRIEATASIQGVLDGAAVLTQSCKACHTPDSGNVAALKKIVLFDEDGNLKAKLPRAKIFKVINDNHMPPSMALSAEKKEAVRKWSLEGIEDLEY